MTPGTGDLDMRKIGQARNTLMDMRLSQVINDHFELYQCLCAYFSVMLELFCFSFAIRFLTRSADRRWWIPKVIWQISTPWSPHMEVTSGGDTDYTLLRYTLILLSVFLFIYCVCVKWHQEGSTSPEISEGDQPSSSPCLDCISQAGGGDR